jgi:hypothetical protein
MSGGPTRPVFEDDGRQYIIGDDGKRVYGVWFVPREFDTPIVVEGGDDDGGIPF